MKVREGWAYGTTDSGDWLTILGSHWKAPDLALEAGGAIRPDVEWIQDRLILARVRETWHPGVASGRAYRILEVAARAAVDGA